MVGVKPERSGGDHLRGSSRNLLCQLMARLGTFDQREAKERLRFHIDNFKSGQLLNILM